MKKCILNNGVKLIYEQREGSLSSFCIGFEAGALMEEGFPFGTAHALEHMLFKGTSKRTEYEINRLSDELFAFNNAMTNYPYSIYYGTTLSSQFINGLELYSDILLNPSFSEEGFKEEMNIICEELQEWKDDVVQYCEDLLLRNSFCKRRIRERIIGTEESIKAISLEILKEFYNKFYCPENCIITVVSSLSSEKVLKIVEEKLGRWEKNFTYILQESLLYESNKSEIFIEKKQGLNGAKLQYIYPIHNLNERDLAALRLFNLGFGEGTSSFLYDEIRTKHGLVYDIKSSIKNEKGIKLLSITSATSLRNVETTMKLINNTLLELKGSSKQYNINELKKYFQIIKLKREFMAERAVEYCKSLTTYEIMYGDYSKLLSEIELLYNIKEEDISSVINKTLINPSIQIISPV